jgi:ribosome-associated protein
MAAAADSADFDGISLSSGYFHGNFTYFVGIGEASYGVRLRISNTEKDYLVTRALRIPRSEVLFEFSRSGGPGGQHVNKVSTRVDLLFDVLNSPSLSQDQRERILRALGSRIGRDGFLRVTSSSSRSQWKNRVEAVDKFVALLQQALKPRVVRVPTKPTTGSRERRFSGKMIQSKKKRLRSSPSTGDD